MTRRDPWSSGAAHRARPTRARTHRAGSRPPTRSGAVGTGGRGRTGRAPHAPDVGEAAPRHVSAWTVIVFAALTAAAFLVVPVIWGVAAVCAAAGVGVALGWSRVSEVPVTVPARVVIAVAGVVAAGVVGATGDLSWAPEVLGVAVVASAVVDVFTAPTPRDHSRPGPRAGTGPAAPSPEEWMRTGTLPSLALAMAGVVVVVGGSSWVAMAGNPLWSSTVVLACFVAAVVVGGDQVGRSRAARSAFALAAGVLAGAAVAFVLVAARTSGVLTPTVLPALADLIGETGAVLVHGVVTGGAVSLAVIVLDAVLGGSGAGARVSTRGALARGCATFLVAAVPIYVMIRVGGV